MQEPEPLHLFALLTLAELEALTGFGLTGFLTLNHTGVTHQESFLLQGRTVLDVVLAKCTGYCHAQCLSLSGDSTAVKVSFDVPLAFCIGNLHGLVYNVLQWTCGEILFLISVVHNNLARAGSHVDTSYRAFSSTYCVDYFHFSLLSYVVNIDCFGVLTLVGVLRTGIDIKVAVQSVSKTVLRKHSTDGVLQHALRMAGKHLGRGGLALASRISGIALVNLVGHLLAGENYLLGIDDDHVVAAINMRCEARFGLATQYVGYAGGQTAYGLVLGINKHPFLLDGVFVGGDCFVT